MPPAPPTGSCATRAPPSSPGITSSAPRRPCAGSSVAVSSSRPRWWATPSRSCSSAPRSTRSPAGRSPTPASSRPTVSGSRCWTSSARSRGSSCTRSRSPRARSRRAPRCTPRWIPSGGSVPDRRTRERTSCTRRCGRCSVHTRCSPVRTTSRATFAWQQALSPETRSEVEEVANRAIRQDLGVSWKYMTLADAKAAGAIALFGETYDTQVRVVEIGGPWSRELCGGTHVDHSSQIGMLAVTGESSVGAGARRIEALVGIEAFHALATERALVAALTETLKARPEDLVDRVDGLLTRLREAEKELAAARQAALLGAARSIACLLYTSPS